VLNSFNFLEINSHKENTAKIKRIANEYNTNVLKTNGTAENNVIKFHSIHS
jgi:hypothetical protein